MIFKEEIKKLADLARIEIKEEEQEKLAGEMGDILNYVKIIQDFHSDENEEFTNPSLVVRGGQGGVINVLREDENPSESGLYTDDVLKEAPQKENGYIKVKKILG